MATENGGDEAGGAMSSLTAAQAAEKTLLSNGSFEDDVRERRPGRPTSSAWPLENRAGAGRRRKAAGPAQLASQRLRHGPQIVDRAPLSASHVAPTDDVGHLRRHL